MAEREIDDSLYRLLRAAGTIEILVLPCFSLWLSQPAEVCTWRHCNAENGKVQHLLEWPWGTGSGNWYELKFLNKF